MAASAEYMVVLGALPSRRSRAGGPRHGVGRGALLALGAAAAGAVLGLVASPGPGHDETAANLAEGQRTATLESKTNFIAGCRSGTVQAEAKPIHKGKRTHVWETRITDEAGKLLSVTTQTQMIL